MKSILLAAVLFCAVSSSALAADAPRMSAAPPGTPDPSERVCTPEACAPRPGSTLAAVAGFGLAIAGFGALSRRRSGPPR